MYLDTTDNTTVHKCMMCLGKVFSKLGYNISDDVLQKIVENKPHFVEYLLVNLKIKIERYLEHQGYEGDYHESQSHLMTTLYKQDPTEAYHQEEYSHHPIAAPLNSNKTNSYQNDYSSEGEVYGGPHQQAVNGTRVPSQLPVPISNHKLTSRSHTGAQYNTSQTPTLPPIVLSSHPGKKKGFSAPDRSKYQKPSNFW